MLVATVEKSENTPVEAKLATAAAAVAAVREAGEEDGGVPFTVITRRRSKRRPK